MESLLKESSDYYNENEIIIHSNQPFYNETKMQGKVGWENLIRGGISNNLTEVMPLFIK